MIVIVTGGRRYKDRERVFNVLDAMHATYPIALLIHGACPVDDGGADLLGEAWAKDRCVPYLGVPADKTRWPQAGPERNRKAAQWARWLSRTTEGRVPVRCVAFPGGRGTADMVKVARQAEFEVTEFK